MQERLETARLYFVVEADAGAVLLRMDDTDHRIAVHHGERNRMLYAGWDVGSEDAQAALRSIFTQPSATTDPDFADNVRRFGGIEHPEVETAGLLEQLYASPSGDKRAVVETLGTVTGKLNGYVRAANGEWRSLASIMAENAAVGDTTDQGKVATCRPEPGPGWHVPVSAVYQDDGRRGACLL